MTPPIVTHGGTDAGPPIEHDFSTNAHPLGPPPEVLEAVLAADRQRYPDPSYTTLRALLGDWHGVEPHRVLPTAGGAEAIRRMSLAALLDGRTRVCVPQPGFGDYRAAAEALGLPVVGYTTAADLAALLDRPSLVWVCDPCSPTGTTFDSDGWLHVAEAAHRSDSLLVVDQAYEPLRLEGRSALPHALADQLWRLVCPNKALAMTGVRAAYLLAPLEAHGAARVEALAPSWVLSAEGEALLRAWASPCVQKPLAASLPLLREWKASQRARFQAWGLQQQDVGVANFWLARLPDRADDKIIAATVTGTDDRHAPMIRPHPPAWPFEALRAHGVKLRDATSFGMPGWVRVSVQAPDAVEALGHALRQVLPGGAQPGEVPARHGAWAPVSSAPNDGGPLPSSKDQQ